jgi:hypothetical protein
MALKATINVLLGRRLDEFTRLILPPLPFLLLFDFHKSSLPLRSVHPSGLRLTFLKNSLGTPI